jgi:hypothetical protein
MNPYSKIDAEDEEALQEISHKLEELVEEIRARSFRGREVIGLVDQVISLTQIHERLKKYVAMSHGGHEILAERSSLEKENGNLRDPLRWRSIADEPPPAGICIFRYENSGNPFSTHGEVYENGVLFDRAEMAPEKPTHWMPMPDPLCLAGKPGANSAVSPKGAR